MVNGSSSGVMNGSFPAIPTTCEDGLRSCSACLATRNAAPGGKCVWLSGSYSGSGSNPGHGGCYPEQRWQQKKPAFPNIHAVTEPAACEVPLPPVPPPPPCTRMGSNRANCWVGHWRHGIGGVPYQNLPDAPMLGNGYLGLLLAESGADGLVHSGGAPLGSGVDLWVNTNAMWACMNNTQSGGSSGTLQPAFPGRLTDAVCNLAGFGGVSLSLPALGHAHMYAEQRIGPAHLYTRQSGTSGTLETLTYVDPKRNVIVTNVTWIAAANSAKDAELNVNVWAHLERNTGSSGHIVSGPSDAGHSGAVPWACRHASADNATGVRRIRTAVAVALPPGAKKIKPTMLPNGSAFGNDRLGILAQVVAASSVGLKNGHTISLVTAVSDNLQQGNGYDPTQDAVQLAQSASASDIASAAAVWWQRFWNQSSIALPGSPAVESYWYGTLYAIATMNPSKEMMWATNNLVPPAGPYGNQVTTE